MLETYIKRDILTRENIKEVTTKTTIRISDKTSVDSASRRGPTASDENQASLLKKVRSRSSKHWIDKCLGVTRKNLIHGAGLMQHEHKRAQQ